MELEMNQRILIPSPAAEREILGNINLGDAAPGALSICACVCDGICSCHEVCANLYSWEE